MNTRGIAYSSDEDGCFSCEGCGKDEECSCNVCEADEDIDVTELIYDKLDKLFERPIMIFLIGAALFILGHVIVARIQGFI